MGAKTIIAIDVGLAEDTSPVNYGDTLSGWTILFQVNLFIHYIYDTEIESICTSFWARHKKDPING
jgi:hypothetical protein